MNLPLDTDGFLRRECPTCEQPFKWHHGPANEEAEKQPPAAVYFCPLCGVSAAVDAWWTQEQVERLQAAAAPAAMRLMQDEIASEFRRAPGVTFETSHDLPATAPPSPLTEPDDMYMVASPCHDYEPVKVPDDASPPFHCLVCGAAFAL